MKMVMVSEQGSLDPAYIDPARVVMIRQRQPDSNTNGKAWCVIFLDSAGSKTASVLGTFEEVHKRIFGDEKISS